MLLSKSKIEPIPSIGDYKIIRHFALLPAKVDGCLIWLEYYKKVYEYRVRDRFISAGYKYFKLKDIPAWDLIAIQRYNKF